MLIAIAIAEKIRGLQRIGRFCKFWTSEFSSEKLLAKVEENSEAQNLQNFYAILCNPWISSAMAMAMSIYRTLCVLVLMALGIQESGRRITALLLSGKSFCIHLAVCNTCSFVVSESSAESPASYDSHSVISLLILQFLQKVLSHWIRI